MRSSAPAPPASRAWAAPPTKSPLKVSGAAETTAAQLIENAERLESALRERGESLVGDIGKLQQDAARSLNESAERVATSIRSEGLGIVVQLETAAHATSEAIAAASAEINDRLAASGSATVEAFRGHGDAIAARLEEVTLALGHDFGEHGDRLVDRLELSSRGAVDALQQQAEYVASAVTRAHEEVSGTFEARAAALVDAVTRSSREAVSAHRRQQRGDFGPHVGNACRRRPRIRRARQRADLGARRERGQCGAVDRRARRRGRFLGDQLARRHFAGVRGQVG